MAVLTLVVQRLHPSGAGCTPKTEARSSSGMVTTYQMNIVTSQKMVVEMLICMKDFDLTKHRRNLSV
jgi:hypothetical protein